MKSKLLILHKAEAIEYFFNAMVLELEGTDDGVTPTLDYLIIECMEAFKDNYLKSLKGK